MDASGNKTWEREYGDIYHDGLFELDYSNNPSSWVVAGYTVKINPYYPAHPGQVLDYAWMQEVNSTGTARWTRTFGIDDLRNNNNIYDYDECFATSIHRTADKGYIVAGCAQITAASNWDLWIMKLDNDGNVIWNKIYGDLEGRGKIRQMSNGGYFLLNSGYILVLDINGNILWNEQLQYRYGDYSLETTSDGGFIAAGEIYIENGAHYYSWIQRFDKDVNRIWDEKFSAEWDAAPLVNSVWQIDGGYITAGEKGGKVAIMKIIEK